MNDLEQSKLRKLIHLLKLNQNSLELLYIIRELKRKKRNMRRWWVKPHLYDNVMNTFGAFNLLCTYFMLNDHEEFAEFLRMSFTDFTYLLSLTKNKLQKQINRRKPIPAEVRLAVTLHVLGHSGSVKSTASIFRLGKLTLYLIISETCAVLTSTLLPLYVPLPNKERWLQIAEDYYKLWNFPNCIGAIDGKHIQIKHPAGGGSLFFNYMKFDSIVLMATCDADYRFTYFNVGDYGSYSDSSVFAVTELSEKLNHKSLHVPEPRSLPNTNVVVPFVFVGDEIFPLSENLMKPYNRRVIRNDNDKIFNYRLSRARFTIECSFGTSKWRILQGALTFDLNAVISVVSACISLHNFLITRAKPININENGNELPIPEAVQLLQPAIIRHRFTDYFSSPEGSVEWQWRYI